MKFAIYLFIYPTLLLQYHHSDDIFIKPRIYLTTSQIPFLQHYTQEMKPRCVAILTDVYLGLVEQVMFTNV